MQSACVVDLVDEAWKILDYIGEGLVCALLLFAEFVIGRRGRGDAAASIATVDDRALGVDRPAGDATGFLILGYYTAIGGLTVA